ncbi:hypothetical protein EJB05_24680, partial [Eragrostis curvula]
MHSLTDVYGRIMSCAVQMLVWDEPKTKYHSHICYDMIYTVPVTPNIHVHIRNVDLWLHLHSDTAVSSCRSFSRIKKRQCCMPTGQETLHGGGTWTAPELCSPPASPKPGCSSSSGVTRRRPALCSPPAPGPVHAEAVAERPPSPSSRRRMMQDDGATADGEVGEAVGAHGELEPRGGHPDARLGRRTGAPRPSRAPSRGAREAAAGRGWRTGYGTLLQRIGFWRPESFRVDVEYSFKG